MESNAPALNPTVLAIETAALVVSIMSLPRLATSVDAFVVVPGCGEVSRDLAAINLWKPISGGESKFLIFAGENQNYESAINRTPERLLQPPFNLDPGKSHLYRTQGIAAHTKAQANWIAEMAWDLSLGSIGLCVSPWHMPRAYLTVLKSLLDKGIRIPILPLATQESLENVVPSRNAPAWDETPAELSKIAAYQLTGDVAGYNETRDYLKWLWQQPMLEHLVRGQ